MTFLESIDRSGRALYSYHYLINHDLRKLLLNREFSEELHTMLILIGDNYLDEDDFKLLLEYKNISALSEFLTEYESEVRNTDLWAETRKKLFRLALNTQDIKEIKSISFFDALHLNGKAHISITENYLLKCDLTISKYLFDLNIPLYFIKDGSVTLCTKEDIDGEISRLENKAETSNETDEGKELEFIPSDYMAALTVSNVMGEKYINDFIVYCKRNSISVTNKLKIEYDSYVMKEKLSFSIRMFRRYRSLGGSKYINIIDYKLQNDFDMSFTLNIEYSMQSENALLRDALKNYMRKTPLNNYDVLWVQNNQNMNFFVYKKEKNDFETVEDGFTVALADLDKLKTHLNENQQHIKTDGNAIEITNEKFAEGLTEEDLFVAFNMLRQELKIQKGIEEKQNQNPNKPTVEDMLEKINNRKKAEQETQKAKLATNEAAKAQRDDSMFDDDDD